MHISFLPRELIEDILALGDPAEMSKMAKCSRLFREIVYFSQDVSIWRAWYLALPLDDPRICYNQDGRPRPPIDWKAELKRVVRARMVALAIHLAKPDEHTEILQTFLDLTKYVPALSSADSNDNISNNLIWVATILRKGFLDEVANVWKLTQEETQIVARIHSYFGVTRKDLKPDARVQSRAFVYDMRKYRADTEYGPLLPEGGVDWVHVQMIHHVVSMHLLDANGIDDDSELEYVLFAMSMPFTQIILEDGVDLDNDCDWAGVTGRWSVSFCFCDHRELLAYNSTPNPTGELDTSLFEDEDFREVFRSLVVDITVHRNEPDPAHPGRPIIFFIGKMKDPSSSTINGSVRMTKDNQVQWHFVSGEPGNAIWSSEGVQVGGIRSVYGVLGSWTTIFHDRDDPVGPFWLRKLNGEDNIADVINQQHLA